MTIIRSQLVAGVLISLAMTGEACAGSKASDCVTLVSAFLVAPSSVSLSALNATGTETCWSSIESSNPDFQRLLQNVEKGDQWAAQYLIAHMSRLDGGNLEDALVAVGQFSEHDMERLLAFGKEGVLARHQLEDALTMLPLSFSDNQSAQLSAMESRAAMVTKISRTDLAEQRTVALDAINAFIAEIKRNNEK